MFLVKRDYLELGPVPCNEECEPAGMPNSNPSKAREECRRYKRQLERMFPKGDFGLKKFPYADFSYSEVVIYFDSSDARSRRYAFHIEAHLPANWDAMARQDMLGDEIRQDIADGARSTYQGNTMVVQ